jgi:tetratricopeptide (TPR) repeat protein
LGDVEDGLKQCRDGVQGYSETGATARISYLRCLLADILVSINRADEALDEMDKACAIISDAATRAEQLRMRSEVLDRLGKTELAEQSYLDALTTARNQEALSWELRTAIDLSRLWLRQSRRKDAEGLLQPVYNKFTEGFETPDLKRAKGLLDQLAA